MMDKKKGQMTMFMILGIVVLIGASFIFYSGFKKSDDVEAPKISSASSIEMFIETCLERSAKDWLRSMGRQGGILYASQDGWYPDFTLRQQGQFYILYGTVRIPYLIRKPFGSIGLGYSSESPVYPWDVFPMKNSTTTETTDIGYFGVNTMIPLYKTSNDPSQSIQGSLESAIQADVKKCRLDAFEKQYEIDAEEPKVKIDFFASTIIHLDYAMTATDNSGSKTRFSNFTISIPINYAKLYSFVFDLINKDSSNISFNISKAGNADYSITVKKNASDLDDIIIVTDKKGRIDGKPYEFHFARKNRIPALAYIEQLSLAKEQMLSTINVKAYDPDEDEVTVNYALNGVSVAADHQITPEECGLENLRLLINITDGEYADSQFLTLAGGTVSCI